MEKGSPIEVPEKTDEAEEQMADPAEENKEVEPEEGKKEPEVIPIEDDDIHMVTLEDVLATTVPTLPKRTVGDDEEGTQQRMPKRKRILLVDVPEEPEEEDGEEDRMQMERERKGKEWKGQSQRRSGLLPGMW